MDVWDTSEQGPHQNLEWGERPIKWATLTRMPEPSLYPWAEEGQMWRTIISSYLIFVIFSPPIQITQHVDEFQIYPHLSSIEIWNLSTWPILLHLYTGDKVTGDKYEVLISLRKILTVKALFTSLCVSSDSEQSHIFHTTFSQCLGSDIHRCRNFQPPKQWSRISSFLFPFSFRPNSKAMMYEDKRETSMDIYFHIFLSWWIVCNWDKQGITNSCHVAKTRISKCSRKV